MSEKVSKRLLLGGFIILIILVLYFVLTTYIVQHAEVPTNSMEPTVMTGEKLIINRLSYKNNEPERGDIVSFYLPDDETQNYLKRVIGLPNETIEGINGIIYINGKALEEDYTDILMEYDFGPYVIPQDCYFMIGDNRNDSFDSRYWEKKFVPKEMIIGKAVFSYYPEFKKY